MAAIERKSFFVPRGTPMADKIGIAGCDCGCGDVIVTLHSVAGDVIACGRLTVDAANHVSAEIVRAVAIVQSHQVGRA
jgi:hypothetical protein